VVTTAAAEKVYRTLSPETLLNIKLDVAAGACVAWLPHETILFDDARLLRRIEVDLAETARLVIAEAVVFGRAGVGETMRGGQPFDRWMVRRAGRLIHAENVRLDGLISQKLAASASARGGIALGTVLAVPGDEAMMAAVRALADWRGEVGASTW